MAKPADDPKRERKLALGRERARRTRERKRAGILMIELGLDERARLDLVDDSFLDWNDMDDRVACARAVVEWMRVTRYE